MNLEHFVEVLLVALAVLDDFVLVAGELEALFAFFEADEGDVGEFDLVGGLGRGQ